MDLPYTKTVLCQNVTKLFNIFDENMNNYFLNVELIFSKIKYSTIDHRIGQGIMVTTWVSSTMGPMIFGGTPPKKN